MLTLYTEQNYQNSDGKTTNQFACDFEKSFSIFIYVQKGHLALWVSPDKFPYKLESCLYYVYKCFENVQNPQGFSDRFDIISKLYDKQFPEIKTSARKILNGRFLFSNVNLFKFLKKL